MVEGKRWEEGMRGSRERRHKRKCVITFLCHVIAKSGISVELPEGHPHQQKKTHVMLRKQRGFNTITTKTETTGK